VPVAPSAEGGEESALLAQLPEMSDDEVDALLKRMLAEPEGS
jgi:hypothetical protein